MEETQIKEDSKICTKCGKEKSLSEYQFRKDINKHNSICRECVNLRIRNKYSQREDIREKKKVYRQKTKAHRNELNKKYYKEDIERGREKSREGYYRNHEWRRFQANYRNFIRMATDPQFRIKKNLGRRINHVIKGKIKGGKTIELLGCTPEQFIEHLKSLFKPGMTVEKLSTKEIHLDHIIPICMFDLTDIEQQKICFHYTNYQPLWATENMSKNGRYIG